MLKTTTTNINSSITSTRMRYRGPIESLKINKLKEQVFKDLSTLKSKFDTTYNSLNQYVKDTVDGISTIIVVQQDANVIYNGVEKENTAFLNHRITALLKED